MSIEKFEQAKELIKAAGGGDFEGTKSEELVAKAEAALGLTFPPSYRCFLLQMGCGDINGLEVFGLVNDNFEKSSVPNGIWLTLNQRCAIGLDPSYVIIGDGGEGTYYALNMSQVDKAGEAPVVLLSVDGRCSEQVACSFGDYLLEAVRRVLS